MPTDDNSDQPKLHELTPTETSGRSTIGRYQAQFRAAAFECLSILAGNKIDRVYCDYHDDFVARESVNGKTIYHFFQVKTKGKRNYRWTKREVFGLYTSKKEKPQEIRNSIGGKLLVHTVRFKSSCGNVVLLTNVHFDDSVEDAIASLEANDFENVDLKAIVDNFNDAFVEGPPLDEAEIQKKLKRFGIGPGITYLDPNDATFGAVAREAIYKYSEVDLEFVECEEIIHSLIGLVERKSFTSEIATLDEEAFDDAVGVGISDLLDILCISKGAYQELLHGGDPSAIKSASIIQRKLQEAGASEDIVEYCSKSKVDWDNWFRNKRHTVPEFDLAFLLDRLNEIKNAWKRSEIRFQDLDQHIESLWEDLAEKGLNTTLTKDLLLGGVFSVLVRSESQ